MKKDTLRVIHNSIIENTMSLLGNDNGKQIIKEYINKIAKCPDLKDILTFYYTAEHATSKTIANPSEFIDESINIIHSFDKKLLNKHINELKAITSSINKCDNTSTELQEAIDYVIFTDKNINNINEFTKYKNIIKESILNRNVKENIDIDKNTDIVKEINEKYSNINKEDRDIIQTLFNGSHTDKENVLKKIKNECIEQTNKLLSESNNDMILKEKLLNTKEQLLNFEFNEERYVDDLKRLFYLKNIFNKN